MRDMILAHALGGAPMTAQVSGGRTVRPARTIGKFVLAALLAGAALAPLQAVAAQPAGSDAAVAPARIWSPEVLSGRDRELYRQIFAATRRGHWKKADALEAKLSDKRLMGYVLYEKYLGPHYHTPYSQLAAWMKKYRDLPGAKDIYKLAVKRHPRNAAWPARPARRKWRAPAHRNYAVYEKDDRQLSSAYRRIAPQVRRHVASDSAEATLHFLKRYHVKSKLDGFEYDKVRVRVAASAFLEGNDKLAYRIADEISSKHARHVPLADWYAGLSAWRQGHYADAARHFRRLSEMDSAGDWTKAAGGFWAARAYLADHDPENVAPMLERAAATGATFYGLLATRQLGRKIDIDWVKPKLDQKSFRALIANKAVARAVALVQIGRKDLAEQELLRAHGELDPSLDQPLIALAQTFALPAVALQVASAARVPHRMVNGRVRMNAGLFPIPDYKPKSGYKMDRALIFAFMRQESRFKPDAKSYAGARGLMQIMPATASHITNDHSLAGRNRDKLLDPNFNVALGQDYLSELMSYSQPQGNLFMLTTAYNGGPGNLMRWLQQINFKGDPFLFIESIPAAETRGYIERVISNFWLYRSRLGQPVHSLDESASGTWPVYKGMEDKSQADGSQADASQADDGESSDADQSS